MAGEGDRNVAWEGMSEGANMTRAVELHNDIEMDWMEGVKPLRDIMCFFKT